MPPPEMPALYAAMDAVAGRAQRVYLRLLSGDLLCLLAAGVISTVQWPSGCQQVANVATAVLFAVSLVLTLALAKKSYQRTWYRARAAAESIKTLVWRYATVAPPYPAGVPLKDVDTRIASDMQQILREAADVSMGVAAEAVSGDQISASMRDLRRAEWQRRKASYLTERVGVQRQWYKRKAKWNEQHGTRWFVATMVAQGVALVSAIIQAVQPGLISAGGILAAVAAACMAWLQAKDFDELAQAYAVTAHELGLVAAQGEHIDGDETLARFVASAEDAISREHTLWLAKRDRRIG